MLTRTLFILTLFASLAAPTFAQKPEMGGERKVHGKVPGMLPRRVPSEGEDRLVLPEVLKQRYPELEVTRTVEQGDGTSDRKRAARMLQSPVGRAMPAKDLVYYEAAIEERLEETTTPVNREDVGPDKSWLFVGGGALLLGLGMAWWIRRLL